MGIRDRLIGIRQRYRKRFGIASGYRQLEPLRRPQGTRDDLAQSRPAADGGWHRAGAAKRVGVSVGVGAVALSAEAGAWSAPR